MHGCDVRFVRQVNQVGLVIHGHTGEVTPSDAGRARILVCIARLGLRFRASTRSRRACSCRAGGRSPSAFGTRPSAAPTRAGCGVPCAPPSGCFCSALLRCHRGPALTHDRQNAWRCVDRRAGAGLLHRAWRRAVPLGLPRQTARTSNAPGAFEAQRSAIIESDCKLGVGSTTAANAPEPVALSVALDPPPSRVVCRHRARGNACGTCIASRMTCPPRDDPLVTVDRRRDVGHDAGAGHRGAPPSSKGDPQPHYLDVQASSRRDTLGLRTQATHDRRAGRVHRRRHTSRAVVTPASRRRSRGRRCTQRGRRRWRVADLGFLVRVSFSMTRLFAVLGPGAGR